MLMRREPSHQFRLAAIMFLLFQKSVAREEIAEKLSELEIEENEFRRIRCPLCGWQPTAAM